MLTGVCPAEHPPCRTQGGCRGRRGENGVKPNSQELAEEEGRGEDLRSPRGPWAWGVVQRKPWGFGLTMETVTAVTFYYYCCLHN